MRGSEAIQIIGSQMFIDFSISEEPLRSVYKTVYTKLTAALPENDKSKGIAILGGLGVGKSAMMKIYQKMFLGSPRSFKWVNSIRLRDLMEEMSVLEIKNEFGSGLKSDLYIDDLGVFRGLSSKYGNSVNIVSEIILDRYDLFVSCGYKTHISSNLPLSLPEGNPNIPTIELIYGARVKDRLFEMCDFISINGKSLRK